MTTKMFEVYQTESMIFIFWRQPKSSEVEIVAQMLHEAHNIFIVSEHGDIPTGSGWAVSSV